MSLKEKILKCFSLKNQAIFIACVTLIYHFASFIFFIKNFKHDDTTASSTILLVIVMIFLIFIITTTWLLIGILKVIKIVVKFVKIENHFLSEMHKDFVDVHLQNNI